MFYYDLILRKVEIKDLKKLFDLKVETMNNHHSTVILNETDQQRWFDSIDKNVQFPLNIYFIGMDESDDVGIFGLSKINYVNRNANVSCDVFPEFRAKGYGTKILSSGIKFAKEVMNLNKLCCEILDHNIASKRMVEKNGFVQEGLRKQQVYKNGKYIDSAIYGLII